MQREFLGLGHPEQGGDAPVPLNGASPRLGGGGGALLSHLLQLPVIADKAWNKSKSIGFDVWGLEHLIGTCPSQSLT